MSGILLVLGGCGGGGSSSDAEPNQAPTASFSATPLSGEVSLLVEFDASGSVDSDGTIATYQWNFGDNTSASGPNVSHTYNDQGSYIVVLTVTDNDGSSSTSEIIIEVLPRKVGVGGAINLLLGD